MSYRNHMIIIRPHWASTSCVCRRRYSVWIYPTGSDNTIKMQPGRPMAPAPVPMPAAMRPVAAISRVTLRASVRRTRVAGRALTRRRLRSVRWALSALIVVPCCWVPRRTVIMAARPAVSAAQRRRLKDMVKVLAPHVGPPHIWTPHRHRRAFRSAAALPAARPSIAASCRWPAAAALAVSFGTPTVSPTWGGAAQRSCPSARPTNGKSLNEFRLSKQINQPKLVLFQPGQLAASATHIANKCYGHGHEWHANAAASDAGDTELYQGGHLGHCALCERSDAGATLAATAAAQPFDESQFEVGSGSAMSKKKKRTNRCSQSIWNALVYNECSSCRSSRLHLLPHPSPTQFVCSCYYQLFDQLL